MGMQEGRETLARLKRMAGFESQSFDPQACICEVFPIKSRVVVPRLSVDLMS